MEKSWATWDAPKGLDTGFKNHGFLVHPKWCRIFPSKKNSSKFKASNFTQWQFLEMR